jgi:IS30 family transposase
VRRNRDPHSASYRPHAAHALAAARRPRPKQGKIAANPLLRKRIQGLLDEWWSPEQVAWALRSQCAGDTAERVVHETIYRTLYRGGAVL